MYHMAWLKACVVRFEFFHICIVAILNYEPNRDIKFFTFCIYVSLPGVDYFFNFLQTKIIYNKNYQSTTVLNLPYRDWYSSEMEIFIRFFCIIITFGPKALGGPWPASRFHSVQSLDGCPIGDLVFWHSH